MRGDFKTGQPTGDELGRAQLARYRLQRVAERQQQAEVRPQETLQVATSGDTVVPGVAVDLAPQPRVPLGMRVGQGPVPQRQRQHKEPLVRLLQEAPLGRLDAEPVLHLERLTGLQDQRPAGGVVLGAWSGVKS